MYKIVKNPIHLSPERLEEFSENLRNNNYDIVTTEPNPENIPESLIESYKHNSTHQMILNDPDAGLSYFSISYTSRDGEGILIPIGLFGVSNNRNVRFPLLLNGFWQMFLMSNKEAFKNIAGIDDEDECNVFYKILIGLKKDFIIKIFDYYKTISAGSFAAMAWEVRNEKSNTRIIAESLGYNRLEINEMEIYCSGEPNERTWEYLKNCVARWGVLVDGSQQEASNANYPITLVRELIRNMVNYTVETPKEH